MKNLLGFLSFFIIVCALNSQELNENKSFTIGNDKYTLELCLGENYVEEFNVINNSDNVYDMNVFINSYDYDLDILTITAQYDYEYLALNYINNRYVKLSEEQKDQIIENSKNTETREDNYYFSKQKDGTFRQISSVTKFLASIGNTYIHGVK